MWIFKNRSGRRLVERAKAYVDQGTNLTQTLRKLERQEQEIAALRSMLAKRDAGEEARIRPENITWVFGSGRTGSSWLAFMMGALPDHTRWNEPQVGYLFGHPYYERYWTRQDNKHFILGDDYREFWLSSLRSLVLEGGSVRFPERVERGYLVIKEPHGSIGAPLLMNALSESRMVFLVRDPRDVAASTLDAHRKGSRPSKRRTEKRPELFEKAREADKRPDAFVSRQAATYQQYIELTKQAYEAHTGHKVLIKYEDLRADTLETMKHIYSTLKIPINEEDLIQAVEKYSWENIPEDERGSGKIRRKATPGGWREDLTPKQIELVERETAPILAEFYAEG